MWPGLARASAVRRPKPLDAPVTSMILLITDFLVVWALVRKRGRRCVAVQMIPPLARSVWPLVEALQRGELGEAVDDLLRLAMQEQVRRGRPGRDGVDGDAPPAQLLGQDAGHRLDGGFGAGIDAIGRLQQADDAGREVDDAPALAQAPGRLAQRVECAL